MRGRRDSGRRKEGGICAQLVGSLGAMLFGLGWKLIWRFGSGWGRGENLYTETETSRERGQYQNSNTDNFNLDINYLVPSIIAQLYGKIHNITKWCIITPLTLFRHRLTSMLEKINSKVRNKFHLTETQKHMLTQPRWGSHQAWIGRRCMVPRRQVVECSYLSSNEWGRFVGVYSGAIVDGLCSTYQSKFYRR